MNNPNTVTCKRCGETKPAERFAGGNTWHSLTCAFCEGGDPHHLERFAAWIRQNPDDGLAVHADALEGAAQRIRALEGHDGPA